MEPSTGGSPSKRYLREVKGIAGEMRASCTLEPPVVAGASPVDGPDGDPAEHDLFGNRSSSDENAASRPAAPAAPPTPSPVRFGPRPGSGAAPQAASAPPPASGWDARIEEVVRIEEMGSLSALLEGWFREEQLRPTAAGRRIFLIQSLWAGSGRLRCIKPVRTPIS